MRRISGGKEANKHDDKKQRKGRGPVGKAAVVGAKDRETNQVTAMPVSFTDKATLQGFVHRHTAADTVVYTDDALAYVGLRRPHATVKHSAKEYVDGMAHTNGMESFWAMLKRGYQGVYHQFSAKHLHRYVGEFEGRHNAAPDGHGGADGGDSPGYVRAAAPVSRLDWSGADAAERSTAAGLMASRPGF